MLKLRVLAKYADHEIIIGFDGCVYLSTPDGVRVALSPYDAVVMSPPGIRTELAKQLNGRK
jgi:hypothetical protein